MHYQHITYILKQMCHSHKDDILRLHICVVKTKTMVIITAVSTRDCSHKQIILDSDYAELSCSKKHEATLMVI